MAEVISEDIIRHQLERLARRERGRLVADLVARLGPARLEMAEDVVQDAVIAAMASWPYKGMPEKPAAWLSRVARNKAFDRLRREGRERPLPDDGEPRIEVGNTSSDIGHGRYFGARVEDPELKLIFLCCQQDIGEEDRLMLTLKVVSGFTAKDLAALFLKKDAAVGQRLARAKRVLRQQAKAGGEVDTGLSRFTVKDRLPTVLKVLYLMFSLGYAPRRGDSLILRDVAEEALRLAMLVADAKETTSAAAQALAALLCLQASRFDARVGKDGELMLLRDQNRALWDRTLIKRGLAYLKVAQQADTLSRYHLEAGVAAVHATAPHFDNTDWAAILSMYGTLEAMTGSPIVVLNACVAEAFAGRPEAAFIKLEALAGRERLNDYAPYHIAQAEILRILKRPEAAAGCYRAALACGSSAPVVAHLKDRLAACT